MNISELGVRIKQCRMAKQLTQEKLAELIDVSPHYIYEIEKGLKCMSLSTLIDISSALNISTDYLLFGVINRFPQDEHEEPEIFDQLYFMLANISSKKRENIMEVLKLLLPYIK